jgi:hypothetical protein
MEMGAVIEHWPADAAKRFERSILRLRHELAGREMFSDAGLADILDRYPREHLGVFTMGEALEDWRSWRRGTAFGLDGAALLEAVRSGRLWLNLRHANDHLPEFAALSDEISTEKARHLRTRIMRRDLGLLISSPNARVFYHLDVPLSSLWQLRGQKRIWFYPRSEPFVDPAWLERCARSQAEGQMPFKAEWDDIAESFELNPGDMITWPQNLPHRVDNGPMMNVSLSMEFMTPPGRVRASVLYANGVLREHLGLQPRIQEGLGPTVAAKLLLARAYKARAARRRVGAILPESFAVDATPA